MKNGIFGFMRILGILLAIWVVLNKSASWVFHLRAGSMNPPENWSSVFESMARIHTLSKAPGAACFWNDQKWNCEGWNGLKPDHAVPVGSVTKPMVAELTMHELRNLGKPLNDVIPEFAPIRWKEVLDHRAGLGRMANRWDRTFWVVLRELLFVPMPFSSRVEFSFVGYQSPSKPEFHYSNQGYDLIAWALEKQSGQKFSVIFDHYFKTQYPDTSIRTAIADGTIRQVSPSSALGSGSAMASATDLAVWAKKRLTGFPYTHPCFSVQVKEFTYQEGWGCSWHPISKDRLAWHNGKIMGSAALVVINLDRQEGVTWVSEAGIFNPTVFLPIEEIQELLLGKK